MESLEESAKSNHRGLKVSSARRQTITAIVFAMIFVAWPAAAQDDHLQVEIVPARAVLAQVTQPVQQTQDSQNQQPLARDEKITVPVGTRLSLALVRSLSFKHTKPGASVNLQFVFPVTSGNRVVIPPGTYVQGIIDSITERDRRYGLLALRLRSAEIIFSTGYIVNITGPVDVKPTYGKLAVPNSPRAGQPPVMAAVGPTPTPTLPPLPHVGPSTGELIGIGVGLAAASAVTALVVYYNRDFLMEAGTPVDITLSAPLELEESSVTAAVQQFSQAPPEIVPPSRRMRTCWTTGTPEYPSTPYPCPY